MKKIIIIISLILIIACSEEVIPISLPETIRVQETVVVEVTKVVEKEKIIYLDATYNPEPTWTPTPTPVVLPALTPTAVPLSLPTWTPTPTPKPGSTWTPTPTPTTIPTWTPTPTPRPAATWTPTPTPTPLPPGDLGFELVRYNTNLTLTDVGQVITIGVPLAFSPIVDSDRDNDLMDEIKVVNDPQNYTIMKVTHNRNGISEITLISITPTGETNLTFDFYTTKK